MTRRSILLVEDDPFLAGMYHTKLSLLGYAVRVAADGEEGWNALQGQSPDLLLLDVVLPKRTGLDLLAALRREDRFRHLPVILLSNLGQKADVERGFRLGADDYCIKAHLTPSEVVRKVDQLLTVDVA